MRHARLAGFLSFLLTTGLLQAALARWLGPPRSLALEGQWAAFEAHADEYDVVFIGTSRVQRHIDPRIIDRTLAEQGVAVRSYNLGLPKMSALEGAQLIERLHHRCPRRLKLVVLEPTLYLYDAENWATDRAMAEHDWLSTRLAVRLTWASEDRRQTSTWGKLQAVAPHLLSFVCRTAGLRRADQLFMPDTNLQSEGATVRGAISAAVRTPSDDDRRGFAPLPVATPASQQEAWQQRFRRFMATEVEWNGSELSSAELLYFDRLIQQVRQAGAQPVFLLGPKVKRDSHTAAVYASHNRELCDVALIDHLRSHGDATLYDLRFWHDFDHLNAAGAALFSRELANELAPLLCVDQAFQPD